MMKRIDFTKMVASGNDFVVVEGDKVNSRLHPRQVRSQCYKMLARRVCDRKFGIGADGLLILERSKKADVRMRIFNADGSEAEMCGNGARCTALWVKSKIKNNKSKRLKIETVAGIIEAQVDKANVRIKLTSPHSVKTDLPIKVGNRSLRVNFIDTGVPHTIIFVEGLEKIVIDDLGREIRYHKAFSPKGTNVNFIEVLNNDSIKIRTYERGVEAETLACGTGSTAAALIFALRAGLKNTVNVHTKSGEILKVFFDKANNNFKDVWLEGRAAIAYKGEYYV
ncbi:MAG: diaminopimelate epimerase [Candidatus Omnitrophica bacterium]|nr:diaminopimelate epimerase [Candidatus Omnitrophota bacterium]MBU1869217.1 diaminopimelate epimerase [Candidatus Omnitrophota bacterium]